VTVGQRIKEKRMELNLSVDELAEKLGKNRATIYRYENGDIENLPITVLAPIAEALRTTPAYLMGWDEKLPSNAIPVPKMRRIPVLGTICAGLPVLAEEHIEGYEYADVPESDDYFFLRVKGDSMIGAHILDGSLALIKSQSCAEDGQVVACIINGDEATLKRFYRQNDMVILKPENPAYNPIIVPCNDFESGYARILGVATEVKLKL